jgi:glyoxylase-like metal-dependent hydrolase (beta-lactamase superfamily II)
MFRSRASIASVLLACAALPASAQLNNLDEQLRTTQIRSEKIADNFYVLFGVGGNIVVTIGETGTLIVDAQFPEMVPRYKAAIGQLGGGKIDFLVNTHGHFDHADGNKVLGPEGTWIVAHANAREMMTRNIVVNLVAAKRDQPAYPKEALPVQTYDRTMQFYFNGERVDLMHFGPAHTTGDSAVLFRNHNLVHLGDVYNNAGYPFIDVDNGGSLNGVIEFCTNVLKELDQNTIVVPGHGPVAKYQDLVDFVAMLTTIRDRMSGLIKSGATLEQVTAAKVTAEWDGTGPGKKGDPTTFLNRAYASLTKK